MSRNQRHHQTLNPYIALTDLCINLVLIFALMLPIVMLLGNKGWEAAKYRKLQDLFKSEIAKADTGRLKPIQKPHSDVPGEQRWMFPGQQMFDGGTSTLSPDGENALNAFGKVLKDHKSLWKRVRVEAHTRQVLTYYDGGAEKRSWDLTSQRANVVTKYLFYEGHIEPNFFTASGRGDQDPIDKINKGSFINDRLDILVITYDESKNEEDKKLK